MPRYAKLSAVKFGVAGGIITAICVVLTTLAGIAGYFQLYVSLVANAYSWIGYNITWLGVILGVIYGFISGFILTWLFAVFYNSFI